MSELSDARLIKLPKYLDPNGDGLLVPTEAGRQIPFFQIQRMFAIVALVGAKRGRHAHKLCSQFMLCVGGAIDVVCDDGKDRKSFWLDQPELALLCRHDSGLSSMLEKMTPFSLSCATGYTKSMTIFAITLSFYHFAEIGSNNLRRPV